MKTFLAAAAAAALFSGIAAQIHALSSGSVVLLLALCFASALATALVAVRVAARQATSGKPETPDATPK